MSALVRQDEADGSTWLTFNRPERLNAFTAADYRDLHEALRACATSNEVRVVVLTGAGRAFSAGADRSLLDGTADPEEAGTEFAALLDALASFPKPLLAAVNGFAVGFGATMLLYADVVVVAASARIRFPFTALGIVPEAGSSALVSSSMHPAAARWAMLSSEWIEGEAAVAAGLALRVVPDDQLTAETATLAGTLAALDPGALQATKRLLTMGRADLVRVASERETEEMGVLLGRERRHR